MTLLRVFSAVFSGVAGGLEAAERVGSTAAVFRREPSPGEAGEERLWDPDAALRIRTVYPSQSESAALLDLYVGGAHEKADVAAR